MQQTATVWCCQGRQLKTCSAWCCQPPQNHLSEVPITFIKILEKLDCGKHWLAGLPAAITQVVHWFFFLYCGTGCDGSNHTRNPVSREPSSALQHINHLARQQCRAVSRCYCHSPSGLWTHVVHCLGWLEQLALNNQVYSDVTITCAGASWCPY